MTPDLRLDHIGIVCRDLERARQVYSRLGFRLAPRSAHKGRLTPDGPVETWGSGNHCAMFREGYLELVGVIDPDRYHEQLKGPLSRYEGAHLLALGTDDAAALRTAWEKTLGRPLDLVLVGRDVPQAVGGTRPAEFRIVYLSESMPEAVTFAIEHSAPDALWQPALLDHPNGVTAFRGVTLAVAGPEEVAARLAALFGRRAQGPHRPGVRIGTGDAWIEILSPSEAVARFPDARVPDVPSIMAAAYEVADLDVARRQLESANVPFVLAGDCLRVPAEEAMGCVCEFVAPNRQGRPA